MRRIETYVGVQVYEWFFSAQAQYNMVGLAKLSSALLGTGPIARGLLCAPTAPASMTVQIGKGEVYQQADLEATPCGTLPADTTDQILKQGIQIGTYTSPTFAAPTTSGQSINYLLEAQYQDEDLSLDPTTGTSPVVELFYNSDNPQAPWSGPNDSGAPSNTFRDGIVAWQIKPGAAAATGSQVTPTPDAGWSGLWVVTVPFGATTLTSANINPYPGSSRLPADILPSIVSGALQYGVDSGTANTVQASFPLPSATLTDNQPFWVKIKAANSGATTFTPNLGLVAASPVVGMAGAALQGGELPANGRALFIWRADITSYVLAFCTGGALQIAPATQSQHAVQLGQAQLMFSSLVGESVNSKIDIPAASNTVTYTADGLIVFDPTSGNPYALRGLNLTCNTAVAANGATNTGGQDVLPAPTSGYNALYVLFNPTTAQAMLVGQDLTTVEAPLLYGGAHAPAGYTASALVSHIPTNGSGQFVGCYQEDDEISLALSVLVVSGSVVGSDIAFGLSGAVPKSAKRATLNVSTSNTTANTGFNISLTENSASLGLRAFVGVNSVGGGSGTSRDIYGMKLRTRQSLWYSFSVSAGTPAFTINVTEYSIKGK